MALRRSAGSFHATDRPGLGVSRREVFFVLVVDDFVPHVDWRHVVLQGALDDIDGPDDARAEPSRLREDDLEGAQERFATGSPDP